MPKPQTVIYDLQKQLASDALETPGVSSPPIVSLSADCFTDSCSIPPSSETTGGLPRISEFGRVVYSTTCGLKFRQLFRQTELPGKWPGPLPPFPRARLLDLLQEPEVTPDLILFFPKRNAACRQPAP